MNSTFERYQWVHTPDGKLILVDSWASRVVENAPIYEISTSNTVDTEEKVRFRDKEKI